MLVQQTSSTIDYLVVFRIYSMLFPVHKLTSFFAFIPKYIRKFSSNISLSKTLISTSTEELVNIQFSFFPLAFIPI